MSNIKLDKDSIIQAINSEIEWSKDKDNQKLSQVTEDQATWFIKGLEQAKLLIEKVNKY